MKQKLFTFFLALVASVSTIYASNTQVDGIWYSFNNSTKTATVTYQGGSYTSYDDEYSGSVIIPEMVTYNGTTYSVTGIGNYAFSDCSSLASVTIGNNVTSIGGSAFMGCSSLGSITIPNSVTEIQGNAFSSCTSLISVTIGNAVTTIGSGAFSYCHSLTSITIPNSVTTIADGAFKGCYSLTSLIIPNSITTIRDQTFAFCRELTSITIPNNVRTIGNYVFQDCSSLASIAIPNSVTSIGNYAFYNCSSLASVMIPNSMTSTGYNTFEGCTSLTSITIPNSVTRIERGAFSGCTSLTSITIPNSVTMIGGEAFSYCHSLTSITIPNSVTSILWSAFADCISLTSVNIGNSVIMMQSGIFRNCSSLMSISWNAINVNGYDCSSAFTNINSPNISLYVGDGVEYIPEGLFRGLKNVTLLTLPKTLKAIGSSAFEDCTIQGKIDYKGDLGDWCKIKFQDNPMKYSSEGTTLYINNKEIKDNIILPNSVDSIPSSAFYNCKKISSVKIPKGVKYIGSSAFGNCKKLYDIYCYAQEPPAADETSFANYNVNLYVPCESLKDYQMNPVFGSFKYIQCLDEEEIVEETELPVVSLYDWLLMLNINAINEMGYYFSQSDVNWYRVVGEPDDIHTDFPSDDQLVVEGSYYLTLENSLKGTGNYYAVVDVHQKQDMSGDSFMRSEIISYSTAKQPAKLALLPGVVANGQPLQLIGLNPEETTNIYVYNATGQLINQVSSTGNTTLDLDAASLAGYYQVVVQSLSTTETLRYIVK